MRPALLLLAVMFWMAPLHAAAKPTALDLVGNWEGLAEFGKMKFRMVLRIVQTNQSRLSATIDIPDQGQRGLPIAAVLFNSSEVRIEIDPFQTAYNGRISEDLNSMAGEFEEGPGGRPIKVSFTRTTATEAPEPEKIYTFKDGEKRDVRGHWKTSLEPMPGMSLTFAVNIGRVPDGTFRGSMDILERAAKDIPASSITTSGDSVEMKWEALQMTFNGKLSEDGNRIEGDWKERAKSTPTTFTRLDAPATLLPRNISYIPDANVPDDVRGEWSGTLDIPNQKLRLILKLGKTPDGTYAGTLASPDQGGGELPMSSATVELPKVIMEWKGIRGKFEGTLTNGSTVLDGTWEQFGNKMPLKLQRGTGNTSAKTEKAS